MKTCPTTRKGMLAALDKKYPDTTIFISQEYKKYRHYSGLRIEYGLWVQGYKTGTMLTFKRLKELVSELLNKGD